MAPVNGSCPLSGADKGQQRRRGATCKQLAKCEWLSSLTPHKHQTLGNRVRSATSLPNCHADRSRHDAPRKSLCAVWHRSAEQPTCLPRSGESSSSVYVIALKMPVEDQTAWESHFNYCVAATSSC